MSGKSLKYEENYLVLEKITESLNKDEISIDDLVDKTKEALEAAKTCIGILKKQKGEFKKLQADFSKLLDDPIETEVKDKTEETGEDSPF